MDRFISPNLRNQRILTLISELGIVKCSNVRMSALSGGERKRVALAVQMLNDPAILFCDEPTTGLDSYSASSVIEQLRLLAGRGKAVICTIHQPASGLFDMFHSVYLLVGGGKLALTCTTNEASLFFSSRTSAKRPFTFENPEFLVSRLAVGDDAESVIRVNKICTEFKMSKHYEHLLNKLESELKYGKQPYITDNTDSPYDSILCQFMALLISTPYVGLKVDQEGIQNLQGFLYLVIVETTFAYSYSVMHTFPSEIPILLREVGNGLYTPGAYYISKMIILLPRTLLEPIIYSALVFWIPGLLGGLSGFIQFCIPVIACSIAATAYGCLISAIFENISTGSLLSVPLEQISLLFCGIYMSLSDVPFHFAWVKYVSVFYYGLEAVSILQWSQVEKIPCSSKPEVPCISTGEGVLKYYGYSENNFILDMVGLMIIYCVCHVIGFLAFWNRSKKQAAY
uniref:Uncharacterized protein n=1 Tax=Rhodnius prolixus TaxID=13249 RepID=T1HYU4_RHOPR